MGTPANSHRIAFCYCYCVLKVGRVLLTGEAFGWALDLNILLRRGPFSSPTGSGPFDAGGGGARPGQRPACLSGMG